MDIDISKVDTTRPPKREKTGGRTAGTPNKATAAIRDVAKVYGPAAIEAAARLAGLVTEDGVEVGKAESEQARIAALGIILDRAYGKATQVLGGDPDNPVQTVSRIELVAGS